MTGRTRPISVVVPCRDRANLLQPCLASLRASLRPIDELIVVDSASSTDEVRDAVLAVDATYIRCELPGTSRARNTGWRAARNDVIAFVDDDVRVDPAWAAAIAGAFEDPGSTFVTGRIRYPPKEQITGPAVAVMEGDDPVRLDRNTNPGRIGHSANLAIRRQALEHTRGFDELLGPGVRFRAAEDHDLFDRLFAAGYIGRYEPDAGSYHETWRDPWTFVRLQGSYGFGTGARLAKLVRTDHGYRWRATKVAFVDWGFKPLGRGLRTYYRTEILARTAWLFATAAGFIVGIAHPVLDGHFRAR